MVRTDSTVKNSEQYKNDANLSARIKIHEYNTNPKKWSEWLFEHYDFSEGFKILELGCGNGGLWQGNTYKIPENCEIILSDFSKGMLESTSKNLKDLYPFKFQVVDIQSIPFKDCTFDIIIANHMLYHVPNLDKGLAEVCRVLKPDGTFYASTVGYNHMSTIKHLINEFSIGIDYENNEIASKFGLETGEEILSKYFSDVDKDIFYCDLKVPEAKIIVDYALSMTSYLDENNLASLNLAKKFEMFLQEKIDRNGFIYIEKSTGMFTSKK